MSVMSAIEAEMCRVWGSEYLVEAGRRSSWIESEYFSEIRSCNEVK